MSKHFTPTLIGAVLAAFALVGAGVHGLSAQETAARTASSRPALPHAEVGRYQLQEIQGSTYLLDTQTGRVWVRRSAMAPGTHSDFTADGGKTFPFPLQKTVWEEDRLDWAQGR